MFREMIRGKQQLSREECIEIPGRNPVAFRRPGEFHPVDSRVAISGRSTGTRFADRDLQQLLIAVDAGRPEIADIVARADRQESREVLPERSPRILDEILAACHTRSGCRTCINR